MPSSTTETYEVVGSRYSARSRFATASCAAFSASSVRRKWMNKRSPLCPSRENAALGSSLLCSIEPKRRTASSAAAVLREFSRSFHAGRRKRNIWCRMYEPSSVSGTGDCLLWSSSFTSCSVRALLFCAGAAAAPAQKRSARTEHDVKDELHNKQSPVPLTLEGSYILHQMFRFRRPAWKLLENSRKTAAAEEAVRLLGSMEQSKEEPSAAFSLLGHKGDLLFIHFRRTLEALNAAQLAVANLALAEYLEPTTSYVSVVELGMYEATVRLYQSLGEKGLQPGSAEWNQAVSAELENQKKIVAPRLFTPIPPRRYVRL